MTGQRPAYRVPPLAELGGDLTGDEPIVASTFSGGGGGCAGLRMAGCRVVWASEFVPAAAETYRANNPATPLDTRDIRDVDAGELRELLGEVDILEGSPPCSPFSTNGLLSAGWGRQKAYSGTVQRADDLFFEYARIAEGLRPKVLIAENVAGLVRGVSRGYFKLILARLRDAGYRASARLLDASWLGAPTERRRIFIVGVRDDLALAPAFPEPLPYRRSVRDALPDCAGVMWHWGIRDASQPAPTIQTYYTSHAELGLIMPAGTPVDPETGHDLLASMGTAYLARRGVRPALASRLGAMAGQDEAYRLEYRRPTLGELRALGGFPPDFKLTGSYPQRWERIGRAVPPVMMRAVAATVRERILQPLRERGAA